jgi:hypothetical protein
VDGVKQGVTAGLWPLLKIILLSVGAAITYGILHDQVTARICVEYFTVGHPPVFATESPTLLAFGWGVIATWWVGLALGVPLALAARWGEGAKLDAGELVRPIGRLLLIMAAAAVLSGTYGYFAATAKWIHLPAGFAFQLPPARHVPFLVAAAAHLASYAVGAIGGIAVIVNTVRRRRRSADGLGLKK